MVVWFWKLSSDERLVVENGAGPAEGTDESGNPVARIAINLERQGGRDLLLELFEIRQV